MRMNWDLFWQFVIAVLLGAFIFGYSTQAKAADITIGVPQTANWWVCNSEEAAIGVAETHKQEGYLAGMILFDKLGCTQLGPEPVNLLPLKVVWFGDIEDNQILKVIEMAMWLKKEEKFWVITTSKVVGAGLEEKSSSSIEKWGGIEGWGGLTLIHHNGQHQVFVKGEKGGAGNTLICSEKEALNEILAVGNPDNEDKLFETFMKWYERKGGNGQPICLYVGEPIEFLVVGKHEGYGPLIFDSVKHEKLWVLEIQSQKGTIWFMLSWWDVEDAGDPA